MNDIAKIQSFLDTMSYGEKRCQCLVEEKGRNPFVTISRQTGAGGHTLAEAILERLSVESSDPLLAGWQMIDQELCEMVSREAGLRVTVESLLSKEYRSQMEAMLNEWILGDSPQDAVIKRIFRIMRTFATVGKVLLIGRAGACLTRSLPLGVHIRLVAPLTCRVQRIMELKGLDGKKAREYIEDQDKARARLVKTFFNKDIQDPLLYDVTFNTETLPMDDIAGAVVDMIKARSCHCQPAVKFLD